MRQMEKYGMSIAKMLLQIFLLSTAFGLVLCQDCGTLPDITSGSVTGDTHYGGTATVVCNEGHDLSGSLTCGSNGQWGTLPTCDAKDCGTLPSITSGSVTGDTHYGGTAIVVCYAGHDLSGALTCGSDGQWGTLPTCDAKDCGSLPSITSGSVIGDTIYGGTITVVCNEGHDLSGSLTCGSDGQWGTLPTCDANDCGTLPSITSGSVTGDTIYGGTATVVCNEGHDLSGSLTCGSDGQWGTLPTCDAKDCGPPIINITAGYTIRSYTSTTYKSTVSIDCATAYTGLPADIVCRDDAKWSNPSGCSVVDCGFPPEPISGRIILADGLSLFGYLAIQSCDLSGTTTIQCLESGSWSAEPINCTIKDCGKLFAPLNGFINDGVNIVQSTYLSRADFTCKDGYQLTGISKRQCQSSGKWDGTENPSCEPKGACGSPPLIYNAVSTLNSVGSSATYQCLAGYELVDYGTNTLDCTDKGWDYDTIQCKLQDNLRLIHATFMFTTVIVYDLSILSVNAYYMSQCQMSLQSMIRHKMGSDHVVVHVTDVRRGPLAADSHILVSSTKEATIQLYIALKGFLASNNFIMIDGLPGSFSSISIENVTYDVKNIESKLCNLYKGLQSGCQSGFECVISSGLPECRLAKSADETNTTAIAVAASMAVVIGGLIVVILFLLIRYRRQKTQRSNETEVTFKRSSREAIPQGALSSSYGMTERRNERAEDQYDTLAIQNECYEIPVSQSN